MRSGSGLPSTAILTGSQPQHSEGYAPVRLAKAHGPQVVHLSADFAGAHVAALRACYVLGRGHTRALVNLGVVGAFAGGWRFHLFGAPWRKRTQPLRSLRGGHRLSSLAGSLSRPQAEKSLVM